MSKWNVEIYINGELDFKNKLTVEEIEKIQNFIKDNIKGEN